MAVTLGTSSGFVTTAPSTDPTGTATSVNHRAVVTKDTSPSTAVKITSVGWWLNAAYGATGDYTIGIYAADGGSDSAGTLLYSETVALNNPSTGWYRVTGLDWAISSNTIYWLAVNLNTPDASPTIDLNASSGSGKNSTATGYTSLPADYTGLGTSLDADGMYAIYAVWEGASGPANLKSYNTNLKANIKTINTNPIANVKSLNTNV